MPGDSASSIGPGPRRDPAPEGQLNEHLVTWAEALRAVAESWRFRARAGRLGSHSLAGVLQLAERFEQAASQLGTGPRLALDSPKVEDQLRESEERFRLLVDSVIDYGIFVLDVDGRIATWNAGAERITGYCAEEVIGKPFIIFYTPEAIASGHPQRELSAEFQQAANRLGVYWLKLNEPPPGER